MTPETLHRLISGGESLNVEFKGEKRGPLSERELVETIVCLANRPGPDSAWLLAWISTVDNYPKRSGSSRLPGACL